MEDIPEDARRMKVYIDWGGNRMQWEECYVWIVDHKVYARICDERRRKKWEKSWNKHLNA